MLATVLVMPGGVMLLVAVTLVIALMRTERGQRLLAPLGRRVPEGVRTRARRLLGVVTGEKLFRELPSAVHT